MWPVAAVVFALSAWHVAHVGRGAAGSWAALVWHCVHCAWPVDAVWVVWFVWQCAHSAAVSWGFASCGRWQSRHAVVVAWCGLVWQLSQDTTFGDARPRLEE